MSMPLLTGEQIGRLAELIAANDLSRPVRGRYRRPLFRATALGEKYPAVDFLVDVLGRGDDSQGFFFIQVKGTAEGAGTRLGVEVPAEQYNRLVRVPAPTYVVGVDIIAECSYLAAAYRPRKAGVASLTKDYPLRDDRVKVLLYKEVLKFWAVNRPLLQQTVFKDG